MHEHAERAGTEMADGVGWHTGRTTVVVLAGLAGLVAAGAAGASMLFAEIPAEAPDPVSVTCWDGEERFDPDDCGRPSGVRGLRWVFPSFRPSDEGCRDVLDEHPEFQGPTMWACEVELAGSPVRITYSEVPDVRRTLVALQRSFGDVERTTVEADDGSPVRYEWRRPFEDGYTLIGIYAEHPYAVEVRAQDVELREEALAAVVRFRAPEAINYR